MNQIGVIPTQQRSSLPSVNTDTIEKDKFTFSPVKEKEKNDLNLSDMYISSSQHNLDEIVSNESALLQLAKKRHDCIAIPIAGDLKELMESIEQALSNGETFENALHDRIQEYSDRFGKDPTMMTGAFSDTLYLDPSTGEIIDSLPKSRCIILGGLQEFDYATVKSQADDFATFLRYTVYRQEGDDPEKVNALISELKTKQSEYDTSRFLSVWSSYGDQADNNIMYLTQLYGLDTLDEEGREKLANQLIEEFMRIVDERLASEHISNVKEEMDMMNSVNASKHRIARKTLAECLRADI